MSTNISILILADVLKMLSYITKFKWSYFRKKDWLWKWVKVKLLSHVRLSVTLWTVAYQASWTMGFSKQEYWSRLPFPSPDYGSEFPTTGMPNRYEHICCCCCYVASVVSNSVRPQRRQPTRLSRPWDSPGRNTGVGCHFLLQNISANYS